MTEGHMRHDFLPTTMEDVRARGWDGVDYVIVSGDAYVDHPSFGHALIGRLLESRGLRVGILAQPGWKDCQDFKRFGRPKLGFLIAAGNIDSMVNHYTAAKKPRSSDAYSPGGTAGMRPDRASIVYANRAREAYSKVFIGIGGIEASLRRFAHYDYWDDAVRRSILVDAGADILLYGMAELSVLELTRRLQSGEEIHGIPGTCTLMEEPPASPELPPAMPAMPAAVEADSYMDIVKDKKAYARAFALQYKEQDAIRGKVVYQRHEKSVLVQYPPARPLTQREFDSIYELPYTRSAHPDYDAQGGVPALEEVRFSITNTRGCFGGCSFCALTFHQGRVIQTRSTASVVEEARLLTALPGFKGYIHDIGGPTANFVRPSCDQQLKRGVCRERECLSPTPCKHLKIDHKPLLKTLRAVRELPRIKKAFVRSGLRYDAIMLDPNEEFLYELARYHISGQLKVAPEHISPDVLSIMGKPGGGTYRAFVKKYERVNQKLGLKQFLVPYFISSHPGCGLAQAVELAEYLREIGHQPEQVQDFIPTPGTLSTAMYYSGYHPLTMKSVYIPNGREEKAMQRALLQYRRPANHALVRKALRLCKRQDLIGYTKGCLVPPQRQNPPEKKRQQSQSHAPKGRRAAHDHKNPSGRPPSRSKRTTRRDRP